MKKRSIAFIKARWHTDNVNQAYAGFCEAMAAEGQAFDIQTYDVPGAFEMPLLAKRLGEARRFDAIVAVVLVVDGGIWRHDFVAQAVASGMMQAQMETGVPRSGRGSQMVQIFDIVEKGGAASALSASR